jgi:hypothetical protein
MPPGKYYVGDLCYVMHPQWKEVCDLTGDDCIDGEFNLKNGVRFAMHWTRWGDGMYQDQQGRDYPVDAGSIGCIRVEDIVDPKGRLTDGQVHEFTEPFETGTDGSGVIYFGDVRIDTDPEPEEDEEEYCDEEGES